MSTIRPIPHNAGFRQAFICQDAIETLFDFQRQEVLHPKGSLVAGSRFLRRFDAFTLSISNSHRATDRCVELPNVIVAC